MNTRLYIITLLTFAFVPLANISSQQLAFPGAEGFGKYATGGRTGTVYHVTNLNDAGAGSFRDAVSQPNRIVVFDVGGVIKIVARIVVSPNIYIAGQTAPGEGITVYGNGFSFSGAHNTICRYIRIRMGVVGTSGKDACGIADGHDMIFDHISVSWGRDETFSINGADALRITLQNSIFSQGLLTHSAGGLIQTNGGVTLYRNFYCDNGTRNNKVKGVNQYVNNIVYNWEAGAYIMGGDSEGESFVNTVSNYFIKGPANGGSPLSVGNSLFHIYAVDNWHDGDRNGLLDGYEVPHSEYTGGPDFQTVPYDYPQLPTVPATTLINDLLPAVGASLPYRDFVDYYVINELKSFGKTGSLITNENELPFGTPSQWTLWAGAKLTDTDNDGIPDTWENANGLNPNSASDAMIITASGYTNIENYINSITSSSSQDYLRAPLCLKTDSATQNKLYLSWFDYTEKEQGYIIEKKTLGTYSEIGRTGVNENSFTISGLQPEERDTFRVKAFNASNTSGYSNELIAKTKPVPVVVLDPSTYVPDLIWSGGTDLNWDKSTNNWTNNDVPSSFTDSSKVLFQDIAAGNQSINITDQVGTKGMVLKTDFDYSFQGPGNIAGSGSVNKTGLGKLALLTSNTYTGATVLWNGTMEINTLANGGLPSSIGASKNYDFNWVWKGGKILFSGGTVSTDRNVALDATTEFSVSNSASTVTISGILSGSGGLIKSGDGKLLLKGVNPYEGETVIRGGILELNGVPAINNGIGTSNTLRLEGGTLKTTGGSNTVDEIYPMDIIVKEGTINGFEPYRNCQIKSKVSGNGTLNFNISYVREYITGDWSQFSGVLNANGIGTSTDGSQLMLNNGVGLPNIPIVTSGNTKIVCWQNAKTMYLGGLSGPAGTYLSGSDKQNNGATMTWIVGGASTNETFNGVINNECSNRSYKGTTTIVKEGTGIWRLNGNNIYAGTTTINAGTLIVNGAHTGTGKVSVEDGGTLAGKGSLAAAVEVKSGGTLQPGDSNISNFTMAGLTMNAGSNTQIEINKNNTTNDKVIVNGAIVYGGTLMLTITGTLVKNDAFTLFTGTSMSGTFAQISPATPGNGLKWNFANGILKVDTLPVKASQPLPANNAVNIDSVSVNISWTAGAGTNSYNVFFGTDQSNLTQKSTSQTVASYTVNSLSGNTKYYWRVDAVNDAGTTTGDLWAFTTKVPLPKLPNDPSPADASTNIDTVTVNLGWTGGTGSDSYNIYFGTDQNNLSQKSINQTTASYLVSSLSGNTKYYWRVDAVNSAGTTTGDIWAFTTKVPLPKLPSAASPADASTNIDTVTVNLGWMGGTGSDSYTIYFGIDQNNLTQKSTNQAMNSYTVSGLKSNTTYYWRIDASNAGGTATGTVWSFTTEKGKSTGISNLKDVDLSYFPNPFTNKITIRLNLSNRADVSLQVCDLDGRLISKLAQGQLATGDSEFIWDGKNALGNSLQPGIYLLVLKTSKGEIIKKIVYSKEQ